MAVQLIVVKNISIAPRQAPNDGSGTAAIDCTVFTSRDQARIKNVSLDLSPWGGDAAQPLAIDPRRRLADTDEGVYQGAFQVPLLAEPGEYELAVQAHDTEGFSGRTKATLQVLYRRPPYQPGLLSIENQERLQGLAGNPITDGNLIEVLEGGQEAMQKRLDLIANARRQINLQVYLLDNDGANRRLFEALLEKASQGVEVNVILNTDTQLPTSPMSMLRMRFHRFLLELQALGQKWEAGRLARKEGTAKEGYFKDLFAEWGLGTRGVNLVLFNAQNLRESGALITEAQRSPAIWLQKMVAERRKSRKPAETESNEWITAFGGPGGLPAVPLLDYAIHEKFMVIDGDKAIIGGRNLDDRYFFNWLDLDLYVEGPVVGQLQQGFLRNYADFITADQKLAPAAKLEGALEPRGEVRAQFVQSRPWLQEYKTAQTLVTAIQMARSHIYISSQYVILPDSLLRDALIDAAGRGVEVRILTNSYNTGKEVNYSTGFFISLNYFAKLLEAGIRLFEINGHNQEGVPQPYLHSKEFLIDGEWAAIGSFNLSVRSCFIESENLLYLYDTRLAAQRERQFLARLENDSTEITPAYLKKLTEQHKSWMDMGRYVELLY